MSRLMLLVGLVAISWGCSKPAEPTQGNPAPANPAPVNPTPKPKEVPANNPQPVDSQTDPAAEAKAIEFVKGLKGQVVKDEGQRDKPVTGVALSNLGVTDSDLKELLPLKKLTKLILNSTKITDAGLKDVASFKNLTELNLVSTQLTDAGLRELGRID